MAFAFGESKYVRFSSPGDFSGNPLSVAFWFYPDQTSPTIDNFVFRAGHAFGLFGVRVDTVIGEAAKLRFRIGYDVSTMVHETVSNSYTADRWNHVAATWDGTRSASGVTIYVDGAVVPSDFEWDGIGEPYTTSASWDVSQNSPTVGLEGKLAELGVWTRVLTAGEIAALRAGYSPLGFADGLVFAPPLVRDAVDPISGAVGVESPTPPDRFPHPPVIRPRGPSAVGRAGSDSATNKVPWHLLLRSAI